MVSNLEAGHGEGAPTERPVAVSWSPGRGGEDRLRQGLGWGCRLSCESQALVLSLVCVRCEGRGKGCNKHSWVAVPSTEMDTQEECRQKRWVSPGGINLEQRPASLWISLILPLHGSGSRRHDPDPSLVTAEQFAKRAPAMAGLAAPS